MQQALALFHAAVIDFGWKPDQNEGYEVLKRKQDNGVI